MYEVKKTHIPPILVRRDGQLYVQVIESGQAILAPVGKQFMREMFELIMERLPK